MFINIFFNTELLYSLSFEVSCDRVCCSHNLSVKSSHPIAFMLCHSLVLLQAVLKSGLLSLHEQVMFLKESN